MLQRLNRDRLLVIPRGAYEFTEFAVVPAAIYRGIKRPMLVTPLALAEGIATIRQAEMARREKTEFAAPKCALHYETRFRDLQVAVHRDFGIKMNSGWKWQVLPHDSPENKWGLATTHDRVLMVYSRLTA